MILSGNLGEYYKLHTSFQRYVFLESSRNLGEDSGRVLESVSLGPQTFWKPLSKNIYQNKSRLYERGRVGVFMKVQ